nr:hypothetical protein [Chlamydiota bacterium]
MATVTSNVPEKPVDSPVIAPQNTSSKVAYIALLILSAGICAAGAYGLVNKAGFIAKQLSYTGSLVAASAGGATMLISIALLATSKAAPVAAKESEETTEDDALQFGDAHGWTYSDDGKLEPNQYTFDSKKIAANVDGRVCTFDLVNEHTPFGVKLVVSENGICTNLPQPVQIFEKSDKGHFVPTQNGFNETNTFLQDTYNPFITEAWKSQDGQLTDGSFQFPVAEDGSVTVNGSVVMNSKGEIDIGALGNAINTHLLPIQLEGNIDTPEAALQLFKAENPEDMRYSTAYSQAQQCTFLVIRLHGMYYVKKLIGNYEPLKATRIAQDTPDLIEQADAADKPKGANSTRSAVGSVRSKTTANPKSAASSQVT